MNADDGIEIHSPGTIVLQYVDDNTRFIGVVVGEHMCDRLDVRNTETLESFKRNSTLWHCCLIMNLISDFGGKNRMLLAPGIEVAGHFPWYKVAEVRTATATDLRHEIDHVQFYRDQPCCNGVLDHVRLRSYFFAPGGRQVETTQFAIIIQHYMAGGSYEDRPKGLVLFDSQIRTVYDELAIAIPRT